MGPIKDKEKKDHESTKIDINKDVLYDIVKSHINDMVFIMRLEEGPSFRYVFANEPAKKYAGLQNDYVGKSLMEVLPKQQATNIHNQYVRLLEEGQSITYQDELICPEGERLTNESIVTAIEDKNNSIQYVVSVTRDISPLIYEKEQLQSAKERYQAIIDNNLDAIYVLNVHGEIIEANDAALKLTHYTREKLLKVGFEKLFTKENEVIIKKLVTDTINGQSMTIDFCSLLDTNGKECFTQVKSIPILVNGKCDGFYAIVKDITTQYKQNETILHMSLHDQLTGLWNRKALDEHVSRMITLMEKQSGEFSVIYLDVDRFKIINDTFGLQGGDEFLKRITTRLKKLTNSRSFLYRQGGDEFIYVLENESSSNTERFVQKILAQFKEPFCYEDQEFYISPSIGISRFPKDGYDAESIIQKAFQALFEVKEKGRNHYRFYESHMELRFPNYIMMEAHLRRAIEKEELFLHYQPQVNLSTGKVESFEALLRWNNRKFGFVSPAQFIPLAEETGLINPIGDWVIEKACEQIAVWRNKGHVNVRVAINISPKQFLQDKLIETIGHYLEKYNIPPTSLEIEVTEGAMKDTQQALNMLLKLKHLGIYISVDDFGTGYSSLNYLKSFPIDILKIDQSFVRELQQSKKDEAITMTIIHLAHSLGLEVIAEGVEQEGQVQFLQQARCQKAQGFYFSKPMSASDIEKQLELLH